jgi:hypothetical protein
MIHGDLVAIFPMRNASVGLPFGEARDTARKIGDRRDDDAFDLAGSDEMPQPIFDKDAVMGLLRIRIERRERQNSQLPRRGTCQKRMFR